VIQDINKKQKSKTMEFVAYITDEETSAVVQSVIDTHWSSGVLLPGGAKSALASVSGKVRPPRIAVIDLSDSADEVETAKAVLKGFTHSETVILVGRQNNVSFYRQMLAAGAADYLVKPFGADEFYTTVLNASAQTREKQQAASNNTARPIKPERAKLIVIMGAHGGAGTSTLITNTGWVLAEERQMRTALIDLDVHFGTLALTLDLEPCVGIRDALESPSRIDSEFMESALVRKTQRLAVLSAEENLDDYITFNGAAIELLIESLRDKRDFILVDAPRSVLRRCAQIIRGADFLILVSELTVTGLRNAIKIQTDLRRNFPNTQLHVLVNKQRGKDSGEIELQDFEKQLGIPLIAVIPDESNLALKSINEGLPIPELKKTSRVAYALRRFCDVLCGIESSEKPQKQTGLLGKLGQLSPKAKRIGL
jgi:pilus assembly protein CpaE